MPTALLVGGTGATGRTILPELLDRGYDVTVYNRGGHNEGLPSGIEIIVGDPHFRESISHDLRGRQWDTTVATYGRTRLIADELRHRTGQLVTVSATSVVSPLRGSPLVEADAVVTGAEGPAAIEGIVHKIIETEQRIIDGSHAGEFAGTVLRYPYVYGPYSIVPMEWQVIKRVLDGRRRWALHADGLLLNGRAASANAGRLVGCVIDRPDVAAGKIYHVADRKQLSHREWVTTVAAAMGAQFEFVDVPASIAAPGMSSVPMSAELLFLASQAELDARSIRHRAPSSELARTELGYDDAVTPEDWIARTVEYWLEHPPVVDGQAGRLDPRDFDYEAEDALLAWWGDVLHRAPEFGSLVQRGHAYDHPKAPSTGTGTA